MGSEVLEWLEVDCPSVADPIVLQSKLFDSVRGAQGHTHRACRS